MTRSADRSIRSGLALTAILGLAAALRLLWIDAGWFGVDQGRDLAWAEAIATGHEYPLAGPLMRGRLHLGATYYYFWSIPLWLRPDPLAAYRFAALLGVLAAAAVYFLGKRVGGRGVGLAAALLFATTPTAVIHARVAWAPAALPPLVAGFLLAAYGFRARPTPSRAALLLGLASLGTQLHLAAVPLAGLAGILVLPHVAVLGRRGCALAALAALVPLLPMALAYRLDVGPGGTMRGDTRGIAVTQPADGPSSAPVPAMPPPPANMHAGRITDVLASGGRVIDAMTAPPGVRPRLVDMWAALERQMMPATLLAALVCLLTGSVGRPRVSNSASALLIAVTIALSLSAVLVLPAEAWWYYLDPTLVPAAIALAIAARPERSRIGALAVLALALARTAGLLWWITTTHSTGLIPMNLELLRLGGSDRAALAGRARLPTVQVKERAARVLLGEFRIPLAELWERVHGSGFGDLDTDNGFLFRRAATHLTSPPLADGSRDALPSEAVVVHALDLPAAWTARFPSPVHVGPLALYRYAPTLRAAEATITNCGAAPLPVQPVPDPREYFFGQPRYPAWPCNDPIVQVPVDAPSEGTRVRVFARLAGAGRVTAITADPAAEPITHDVPGAGAGVLLAPGRATIWVTLALDGPAALDLYELHGIAGAEPPPADTVDAAPAPG